jgi:hypothetical protein
MKYIACLGVAVKLIGRGKMNLRFSTLLNSKERKLNVEFRKN